MSLICSLIHKLWVILDGGTSLHIRSEVLCLYLVNEFHITAHTSAAVTYHLVKNLIELHWQHVVTWTNRAFDWFTPDLSFKVTRLNLQRLHTLCVSVLATVISPNHCYHEIAWVNHTNSWLADIWCCHVKRLCNSTNGSDIWHFSLSLDLHPHHHLSPIQDRPYDLPLWSVSPPRPQFSLHLWKM